MGYLRCACFSLVLSLVCICIRPVCLAQQMDAGLPPHGSFTPQQVDTINLANLDVHIHKTIFQKQARGYTVSIDLDADSNNCVGVGQWPGSGPLAYCSPSVSLAANYQGLDQPPGPVSYSVTPSPCSPDEPDGPFSYTYNGYMMTDSNNTTHLFNVGFVDGSECGGSSGTPVSGSAMDGSGYQITILDDNDYTVTSLGDSSFHRDRISRARIPWIRTEMSCLIYRTRRPE